MNLLLCLLVGLFAAVLGHWAVKIDVRHGLVWDLGLGACGALILAGVGSPLLDAGGLTGSRFHWLLPNLAFLGAVAGLLVFRLLTILRNP